MWDEGRFRFVVVVVMALLRALAYGAHGFLDWNKAERKAA